MRGVRQRIGQRITAEDSLTVNPRSLDLARVESTRCTSFPESIRKRRSSVRESRMNARIVRVLASFVLAEDRGTLRNAAAGFSLSFCTRATMISSSSPSLRVVLGTSKREEPRFDRRIN
jgi:hypothetical protein